VYSTGIETLSIEESVNLIWIKNLKNIPIPGRGWRAVDFEREEVQVGETEKWLM